jgi:hydrogenase-4 component E
MHPAPSAYAGLTDVVTVVILLTEFAMLRAPFLRSQVRLYALQSLTVTVLALATAITRHINELYALTILSFVLKVVLVPALLLRLLPEAEADLADSSALGVASMILLALGIAAFGLLTVDSMHIRSMALPTTALALAAAVVLVAFVLIILRADVVSQAMGFFSLENGVSVASLVLTTALSLAVEVAFLFDFLVAVVVFGVIMRVHHRRSKTLSTDQLDQLRG